MKNCAYWLVIIGGINWLLIGLFNFNLVELLFGSWNIVERIVYIIVGLSAVYLLIKGGCTKCDSKKESTPKMSETPSSNHSEI